MLSTDCLDERVKCSVCASDCFEEMLLSYANMPLSAQGFPDLKSLKNDNGSDLNLFQCSSCGLVQLSEKPVSYYKEVIRASSFSDEMKKFRGEQFVSWVDKYNLKGKSILEVGCGRGEYLSILKQTEVSLAHGIEYSKESVSSCINSELSVTKGFFGDENFVLPKQKYDGFICLNFMEHWPNPNKVLAHLKKNLSEDAIGIIEVPNFDMILKQGLYSEFISDHLFYFTKDTLTFMLNYNGFEVIECSVIWHDYILSAVVRKRKRIDLSLLKSRKLNVETELNSFIDKFEKKEVAIWGAGHQSLAVMSLAKLENKIRYVVDSAPFKQGKYTPATHFPIVAPIELVNNPVKAVIIIAASYSNEVARIMKNTYQHIKYVVIVEDTGLRDIS
jgi:2-polyprenyl-3-methyl-5-hydroxy-6-metoxy-1,4-benzoquinol methylase